MKNKIIQNILACLIALIVWLLFTQTVKGTFYVQPEGSQTTSTAPGLDTQGRNLDDRQGGNGGPETDCVKVGEVWDCTDQETLRKLKNYVTWKQLGKTIKATATWYSRKDSCHNPVIRGGKKLCLTAIGRDTTEGRTVACPRNIKLGTRIRIDGTEYICEDRTAEWVQRRNGPTFDIFHEQNPGWGKMAVQVEVL